MLDVNDFVAIKIGLASPEKIREWSYGEVRKPETINYRTLKPERDGLFCERIFGPVKDWECHCGKYKRIRFKGIVCDKCGVEVTRSKVRRERMGHIELSTPVSHIWYFKGVPSRIGLLLDMTPRSLEKVIYFANYIVLDPAGSSLIRKQLLTEQEYREAREKHGTKFKASMGAEAVRELLREIDIEKLYHELHKEVRDLTGQKRSKAIKRLEVVDAFRKSGNKAEWMVLECIPVIPPELRPMVQLDGGRFATSDLNDLYRRVINRNNRLKRLLELGAPEIIVKNEKRMLQEAVDALVDNGRRGRPVTGPNNRPLKSLSDMLKGKQGRFRQNLLGKRVDYSGRSVIVVGPHLKLHQCGFPKEMALELFKPFVMKTLVERGLAHNIKAAKKMVERVRPEVWEILEEVVQEFPILLNRAPTLHRLGIQAFEPVLVPGKAIQVHPLVCAAFNADFDGDQMAVHLPLSAGAIAEAKILMLSSLNILSPSYGSPVCVPTQEQVMGSYWMTCELPGMPGEGKTFDNENEVSLAFENGFVSIHTKIKYKLQSDKIGDSPAGSAALNVQLNAPHGKKVEKAHFIDTTVGRVLFNSYFPKEVNFPFINETIDKKKLSQIVAKCYRQNGTSLTALLLDNLKTAGFKYATLSGTTISVTDIEVPPDKPAILANAEKEVTILENQFKRGLITEEERYARSISIWEKTSDQVKDAMLHHLDPMNPIYMMANSGARGNISQVRQLAGMRGLMADPSGRIFPIPIKANLREGLTVLEYFISTHGARKGLADTALRTADSGYLTRRLIDVTQDIIVREPDCGSTRFIEVESLVETGKGGVVTMVVVPLRERIVGRTAAEDIYFDRKELICKRNQEITEDIADRILETGMAKVKIRSVLTCQTRSGVCFKCYGRNLATGKSVEIGETIGIIAAQSIGEPGTQLTLRTFHTGGVASEDIIQGLPRVEELFEGRKPKLGGLIAENSGVVKITEEKGHRKLYITATDGTEQSHPAPYGSRLKVHNGQLVNAGDQITDGPLNPHEVLRIRGVMAVQKYLEDEVQRVYRSQGVDINDKHIEVIVRQMLRKVKVDDHGDTNFLPGALVDIFEFEEENARTIKAKGKPANARPALLGVTKASLATNSFLSAASFQETTRVLTDAAIKGKIDPLLGLKENVIIGKLIPAGTGMYRDVQVVDSEGKAPPLLSIPEASVVDAATALMEPAPEKVGAAAGKSKRGKSDDDDDE